MAVTILDPNDIIIGSTTDNSGNRFENFIPENENLVPYVEFFAIRKSNITAYLDNQNSITTVQDVFGNDVTSNSQSLKVPLMGFDTKKNKYTTDWTRDVTGNQDSYSEEGFGITSIDVSVKASFVPTFRIKFIDIKGTSLFAQKATSGYGVLLDFPPPLFVLRLKGAYGLLNEYHLHKVKDNYRLNASTGNYEITVDFVGHNFAMLADIPIGFIKAIHYLRPELGEVIIDQAKPPRSFFELTTKGDILYNKIETYKNSSKEYKTLNNVDEIRSQIENVKTLILDVATDIQKYKDTIADGVNADKITINHDTVDDDIEYLFPRENMEQTQIDTLKNNIQEYFKIIKKTLIDDYPKLELRDNISIQVADHPSSAFITIYFKYASLTSQLKEKYDNANKIENDSLIKIKKDLEADINNILGFNPTIKNILKILADDVDYFFKLLIESGRYDDAEKNERLTKEEVVSIQPYPTVVSKVFQNETTEETYIYPGSIDAFKNWGEVQLVENLVSAILRQAVIVKTLDEEQSNENGETKWIPITPLEVNANNSSFLKNDYFNINYDLKKILERIIERYMVFKNYSFNFKNTVYNDDDIKNTFIDFYAKNEAKNLVYSLLKQNDTIVFRLKQIFDNKSGNPIDYLVNKFEANDSDIIKKYANANSTFSEVTFSLNGINLNSKALTEEFNGFKLLDETELNELEYDDSDSEIGKTLENFESGIKGGQSFFSSFFDRVKVSRTNKNVILLLDKYKNKSVDDLSLGDDYDDNFNSSYFNTETQLIDGNALRSITIAIQEYGTENDVPLEVIFKRFKENNFIITYKNTTVSSIFQTPSIIEVPNIYIIYLGWLLKTDESFNDDKSLSNIDKNTFINIYLNYKETNKFIITKNELNNLKLKNENNKLIVGINDFLKEKLKNNGFFGKKYISNSSSTTFTPNTVDPVFTNTYFRKFDRNNTETVRFFDTLINECSSLLKDKKIKTDSEKKEDLVQSSIADNDIKFSIYNDLKTIYDRWFAVPDGNIMTPTPFIDKFKIVDRTMYDISDMLVTFDTLIEDSKTISLNLFTILGNFLSQNNFLFYPIQTSMIFNNQENASKKWKESLGINVRNIVANKSEVAFICLYINKASSNLNIETIKKDTDSGTKSSYPDDSITFKENRYPSDFNRDNDGNIVYVMSVKLGKSNQSYFGNVELDSSEFKNTSESLKLLDDLIKKQGNSNPVSKGQNLFSLYSQRVYTCKIDIPLGNTCIQPCMYFELEGLPMWNGGYLISEIEHSFTTNNKLKTTFKGTRVGKYALPKISTPTVNFLPSLGIDEDRLNKYRKFSKVGEKEGKIVPREIKTVPISQTQLKIK